MKSNCHLVLSGGGIRGFAHVGVYKALVELGYTITSVAGTSMGALIGALIASGKSPQEIEELCIKKSLLEYLDLAFGTEGILSAKKIRSTLKKATDVKYIEELQMPFTVCVTDVKAGKAIYYTAGDMAKIVSASCAVPGIFEPIIYEGKYLIDGGVTDNMPINTKRDETQPLIGVHVNPLGIQESYSVKDISIVSLKILINRDIENQSKQCDIFIEPPKLVDVNQSLFARPQEIIDIGYEYTMNMLGGNK